MLEAKIEEKVGAFALKRGWKFQRKLRWIGRHSAPDRIYARRGRVIFVEYKQFGKKPRPAQAREIKRMREAGMDVYVIDSVEAGIDLFESFQ